MKTKEFYKINHLRLVKKCCATCKYSKDAHDFSGVYLFCDHPDIDEDERSEQYETMDYNVCNAYQEFEL